VFSIYGCYIGLGIVQERIYDHRYGPDKEKFEGSLFLVIVQCAVNCLGAMIVILLSPSKSHGTVPKLAYLKIAGSFVGAMFASNLAMQYMDYPSQMLAKSTKLVPVMMYSVFLGKKFSSREYITVAFVTVGISMFMLYQGGKSKAEVATSWLGLGLCFLSLVLDGYTSPTQEKLIETYKPSEQVMMFWMNAFAIGILLIASIVSGQLIPNITFVSAYPQLLQDILLLSFLSMLGQNAILWTLFRFGPLMLTTITTTRKFFSILASVLWYGHDLKAIQWLAVGLVFFGIGVDLYGKYAKAGSKGTKKQH